MQLKSLFDRLNAFASFAASRTGSAVTETTPPTGQSSSGGGVGITGGSAATSSLAAAAGSNVTASKVDTVQLDEGRLMLKNEIKYFMRSLSHMNDVERYVEVMLESKHGQETTLENDRSRSDSHHRSSHASTAAASEDFMAEGHRGSRPLLSSSSSAQLEKLLFSVVDDFQHLLQNQQKQQSLDETVLLKILIISFFSIHHAAAALSPYPTSLPWPAPPTPATIAAFTNFINRTAINGGRVETTRERHTSAVAGSGGSNSNNDAENGTGGESGNNKKVDSNSSTGVTTPSKVLFYKRNRLLDVSTRRHYPAIPEYFAVTFLYAFVSKYV